MTMKLRKAARKLNDVVQQYYYSLFPDKGVMARLDQHPVTLAIETINVCNANCIFCAYQYQERPHRVMADEVFEKAIRDYAAMGGGDLGMCVIVGDPLIDPKYVERVQHARSEQSIRHIGTITNCLALHKIGAEKLLRSGVNTITVSTTGFSREMYERVYRSPPYDQMKTNVLDLLRTNQRLGRPVRVTIGLRIDRPPEEVMSYPDFQEVSRLADKIESNAYLDSWSGRIRQEHLTGTMRLRPSVLTFMKRRTPCSQLWAGLGVLVDGTVTACACRDLNGDSDLVLGNLQEQSLEDLYRSEYLGRLRRDWSAGRNIPSICRDCTHYTPYTSLMIQRPSPSTAVVADSEVASSVQHA